MNMYISNLGYSVGDNDLRNLFTPYGDVTSAKVITDRETGHSRGFGFVEMSDEKAAKKAIEELSEKTVDGHNIQVSEARPREEKPSRNNGGGGFREKRW